MRLSRVWLFGPPWTVAHQAPVDSPGKNTGVAMPSSRGSFWSRNQIHISCESCIAGRFFNAEPLGKPRICPGNNKMECFVSPQLELLKQPKTLSHSLA